MGIHMDNARVHAAGDCIAESHRLKMAWLPQPAHSPNLSPCDFWFFGFAKQAIQDEVFLSTWWNEMLENSLEDSRAATGYIWLAAVKIVWVWSGPGPRFSRETVKFWPV
jgi:hypothetical protein